MLCLWAARLADVAHGGPHGGGPRARLLWRGAVALIGGIEALLFRHVIRHASCTDRNSW